MLSLSIITPTWNRAEQLPALFQAVRALSPAPLEHIIVDNCSTDSTTQIIQNYAAEVPWTVVHLCDGDTGLYDAMNQGARKARGDALYFLNDDDRPLPDGLRQLRQLLEETGAEVVFGDVWRLDPSSGQRSLRRHRQMNFLTLAERSICQQATLYRRESWQQVGPFSSDLRFGGDYDWMLRALRTNKISAAYGAWPVAIFALGGLTTNPAHTESFTLEMAAIRRRFYSEADLARARRYRQFWRKLPFGLRLAGVPTDAFSVRSFLRCGRFILPDPRALVQL